MIIKLLITIVGVPFSMIFHEIAHCWMARRLIDNMACDKERLSLRLKYHFKSIFPIPVKISCTESTTRLEMFLIHTAGILMNILIAVIAGILQFWLLFAFNLFLVIINSIPFNNTDGSKIYDLLRKNRRI